MKGIMSALAFASVIIAGSIFTVFFAVPVFALWIFLIFAGAEGRAQKALQQIKTTLMTDEQIVAEGIQHRIFALFARRAVVAITNSRIIIVRRGILGGFKMSDIQWKDLADAKLEQNVLEGICGSNLLFKHLNANALWMAVDGIDTKTASTIYSRAQSEEHAWEEKRRVRAMEEVRAAAGGVVVHNAPQPGTPLPAGNRMLAEIQEAKKLLDASVISDAEFQEMKSKILAAT